MASRIPTRVITKSADAFPWTGMEVSITQKPTILPTHWVVFRLPWGPRLGSNCKEHRFWTLNPEMGKPRFNFQQWEFREFPVKDFPYL